MEAILMSGRERKRLVVMAQVRAGKLRLRAAAEGTRRGVLAARRPRAVVRRRSGADVWHDTQRTSLYVASAAVPTTEIEPGQQTLTDASVAWQTP